MVQKVGIPSLVETQVKLDALMDSDTRLYGRMEELAALHQQTEQSLRNLSEAQARMLEAMQRYFERGSNGHHQN